jgi:hypothetical protein
MRKRLLLSFFIVCFQAGAALFPYRALGQAAFKDDHVMLQRFHWEFYRYGHPAKFPDYGTKRWYRIAAEQAPAIRGGRFDLIWLPLHLSAASIAQGTTQGVFQPWQQLRFHSASVHADGPARKQRGTRGRHRDQSSRRLVTPGRLPEWGLGSMGGKSRAHSQTRAGFESAV